MARLEQMGLAGSIVGAGQAHSLPPVALRELAGPPPFPKALDHAWSRDPLSKKATGQGSAAPFARWGNGGPGVALRSQQAGGKNPESQLPA